MRASAMKEKSFCSERFLVRSRRRLVRVEQVCRASSAYVTYIRVRILLYHVANHAAVLAIGGAVKTKFELESIPPRNIITAFAAFGAAESGAEKTGTTCLWA